jgi:hypothetical protein
VLPTSMRYVALGTDAVVVGRSELQIELQREALERLERVAPSTPSIAVRTAALHGAPLVVRRHPPNTSQHTKLTAEVEDG